MVKLPRSSGIALWCADSGALRSENPMMAPIGWFSVAKFLQMTQKSHDQIDRCRHRPNSLRYESDLPWTAANQTWQPDFGDRKPDGNHRGWEDHGRSTWSWLKNPPCRQESSTSKAKKADNYTDNIDQWNYHIYIYIYHMYHRNHLEPIINLHRKLSPLKFTEGLLRTVQPRHAVVGPGGDVAAAVFHAELWLRRKCAASTSRRYFWWG